MSNPFALRSAEVGAPLGIRHNGETITLTFDDASTKRLKAIVDLTPPQQVDEGVVEINGTISITSLDVARLVTPNGIPMTASIRDEDFHVYGRSPDQFGLKVFNVRRRFAEAEHSNLYDINDQQATWHQV